MQLIFYPIADSYWLVAGVAAALLAIVVLVGPGRTRVSLGRRLSLALIRCGIVLLVVLGMLRPTLVYTQSHKEDATLVLLVNQSRSMMVRDSLDNKTRWDSLLATLKDCTAALRNLERNFEIKAYTFDAETHSLGRVKDGKLALPASPLGQETAIGAALDDVLNQENGKRLLGIVMLTDGRQQAIAPRDASPQDIAARLRRQGFPAFPVVFGQSRGLGGVQDVAVVDFPPPASVFVKTEMAIHGEIKVNGYVNQPIPVRLLIETPDGKTEEVNKCNVTARANGDLLPVDFTYIPENPGEYKVTLKVDPQRDELVTTNNELERVRAGAQGGAARAVPRRRAPRGTEIPPPRAGCLAGHQARLHPPRSAAPQGDEAPRPARPPQAGEVQRLHPGRRRFHGLRRRRAGAAQEYGQPRQGPDHAGRLPYLWSGRVLQHAAGQRPAHRHESPGTAEARRADQQRSPLARSLEDGPHAQKRRGTSPSAWPAGRTRTARPGPSCRRWTGRTASPRSSRGPPSWPRPAAGKTSRSW